MKIISTVPSQTELLYDLGLRDEVIGITKFCIHPAVWSQTKTRIGGTKNLDINKITELKPDFILANKEENVKEQIEMLSSYFTTYVSDVSNLEDAIEMIADVGELFRKKFKARRIIKQINNNFNNFKLKTANNKPKTVLYLIWKNPYMTVGSDTFIHDMITRCGLINVFGEMKRYPEITVEQIAEIKPDFIFLSSEPFPFKEEHIKELQAIVPTSKTLLVNGEYFSWYGSRLIKSVDYFTDLINSNLG